MHKKGESFRKGVRQAMCTVSEYLLESIGLCSFSPEKNFVRLCHVYFGMFMPYIYITYTLYCRRLILIEK